MHLRRCTCGNLYRRLGGFSVSGCMTMPSSPPVPWSYRAVSDLGDLCEGCEFMRDNERMEEPRNTSVIGRLLDEVSWVGSKVPDYRGGGRGHENVLTAEVLLPLTYLPRAEFLGEVFRCANGADEARRRVAGELEHAEIVFLPDQSQLGPMAQGFNLMG